MANHLYLQRFMHPVLQLVNINNMLHINTKITFQEVDNITMYNNDKRIYSING